MTWHLHGTVLTAQGTAGNNRGNNEGVKSTLQKIYRNGEPYTTVSAEAIRYALREGFLAHADRDQAGEEVSACEARLVGLNAKLKEAEDKLKKEEDDKKKESLDKKIAKLKKEKQEVEDAKSAASKKSTQVGIRLNRHMPDHRSNEWNDATFERWQDFLDDDVLGFMHANENKSHRGLLEVTRAISTTPWRGEVVANYATPNSNLGITSSGPNPYAAEVHHTRYQYSFSITPERISRDCFARTKWILEGLLNIRRVGGNHAHFLYCFAPEAIVLRWTHDPAPRILYCFDEDDYGTLSLNRLNARVKKGDIDTCQENKKTENGNENGQPTLWVGSVTELQQCPNVSTGCGPDELGPVKAVEKVLERIEAEFRGDAE